MTTRKLVEEATTKLNDRLIALVFETIQSHKELYAGVVSATLIKTHSKLRRR